MSGLWRRIKRVLRMKNEDFNPAQRKVFLAVNLVLACLLLYLIWMRLGCPLPTQEMEFRRLERTHLLPRSEIVFRTGGTNYTLPLTDGSKVRLSTRFIVGLREDGVTLCAMEKWDGLGNWTRSITSLPRGEGPVLVPLLRDCQVLEPVARQTNQVKQFTVGTVHYLLFLLLDAPADTAQAELTIRDGRDGEVLSGPGRQMEDGNWMMCLECGWLGQKSTYYTDATYTLTLRDAGGTVLLEREGDFLD